MDAFFAKHMFHPVIIRWCQWRGCSQHVFANWCWTLALLTMLALAPHSSWGWILYFFIALACFFCIHRVALRPDQEVRPSPGFFRLLYVFFSLDQTIHLMLGAETVTVDDAAIYLVVLAEYARTIKTIPPLETKERSKVMIPAKVRA